MNRLERISAILVRLQAGSVVTAGRLAEQFDVSPRTIYRDIRALGESGIPVTGNAGEGYSLVEGFRLPPLTFTSEEAIAFLMAEKVLSLQADTDSYGLFRSGMDKIRAVMRGNEKELLGDFDTCIYAVESRTSPDTDPAHVLQPLIRCILQKREATIGYFANYNRKHTLRTVEPVGIFFMIDTWYLLAWCRLRNDYRTFTLNRIQSLVPGEKGFGRPHPPLKTVLAERYACGTARLVRLQVSKSALRNIGSGKYFFGLFKEEELADGCIVQSYRTDSLDYFARWFLSFADEAVVLEPAELKERVRTLVKKIDGLHG